jgi:serine/threonine protein kinase
LYKEHQDLLNFGIDFHPMPTIPQNLSNRYRLLSQLGSGGMGVVFKAQDLKLKRLVALKIMHPSLAHNQNFRDRFLQEAQSAARLKHPGIVQVYDIVEEGDYLYFVMNFIEGPNLAQRMRSLHDAGHLMPLGEALELVDQISLALDYAHQSGVLHRDIKPANILLEPVGGEKLPYLGLAKLLAGGLETQVGISMGTPAYMSPEQALGRPVSARSDVYALGVLLYELVTGRLPFPLKNVSEAIHFHMAETPQTLPPLPVEYPAELMNLLSHSLERDPADRLPSAASFGSALGKIIDQLSGESTPGTALPGLGVAALAENHTSDSTRLTDGQGREAGSSIWKKFIPSPEQLYSDKLEIFTSAGLFRTVSLSKEPLTIGRDEDSEIVLDDPKVSRQHARLSFDGENYRITDLNSTNGTFMGKTRLLPGALDLWSPDRSLRIGDHYLRLVRMKAGTENKKTRQDGTLVDMKLGLLSEASGRLGVAVPQANLSVEPGSAVALSLTCLNQGQKAESYSVSMQGLPAGWLSAEPGTFLLLPGQPKELEILIQPPRQPASRASRYPFVLRVTSQSDPADVVEARGAVTVLPYVQFNSQLQPARIQDGKQVRIGIVNQGNALENFTLRLKDDEDALIFQPESMIVKVSEGEAVEVFFTAHARKRRWLGSGRTYPFNASVGLERSPGSSAQIVEMQDHAGEFVSRGVLAWWFIALLAFCLVVALGVVIFLMLIR